MAISETILKRVIEELNPGQPGENQSH